MGYNSQAGVTAFRTQTGKGTVASDIGTAGVAVRLQSGAMAGNRELMIPDAEMGGNRDISGALAGGVSYTTDYEFYVRFKFIATFLKAAFGTAVTTGTAAAGYTHTFTPSDTSELPFLSIYERISSGLDHMTYTDCVINTFHLEADASSYLTGTIGVIGRQQVMGVTPIDVTSLYDNTTMTVGTNITVQYNSVNMDAKAFSFDLNNNFEDDDFRLGSFFLKDLTPKRREITASMTIRHETNALMRQALNGSASSTSPIGITTALPLVIDISTYADIPGVTPATRYSLKFTLPKVIFEPFSFEPSGDDVLENEVSMQAVRPDAAVPIVTAVLKTDLATIA